MDFMLNTQGSITIHTIKIKYKTNKVVNYAIFSGLLMVLVLILMFLGILPFIFTYPFSEGPNSGPSNLWELILMISYEGKEWYLMTGFALLILFAFSLLKLRQWKF